MRRYSSYHGYSWDELLKNGVIPVYGADCENCYIEDTSTIGAGTKIWPGITIDGEVEIGENCIIRKGASIIGKIRIGKNVIIKHRVEILGEGYIGDGSEIRHDIINPQIGRNCVIEGTVIDSVIGEDCEIGEGAEIKRSWLAWGVKAKHKCGIRDATVGYLTNISEKASVANYNGVEKKKTRIGNMCMIGIDVNIIGGVKIGNEVYVADGARVDKDIENYIYFNPGRSQKYPSLYRAYDSNCSWYLEGNYICLQKSISPEERGKFINAIRAKHGFLHWHDEKFGEWLKTPLPRLGNRTPIECLQNEGADCIPRLLE